MRFVLPAGRQVWPWRLVIAAASAGCALALTHALWTLVQYTPFMLGFGAAILSSAMAGRTAGLSSVAFSLVGYILCPLPLPAEGFPELLVGFALISGAFCWLVARHVESEVTLRSSEARLKQAQELAHVGNWQWDVARNELWWSDELYRIFGVDRSSFQLTYSTFLQLIHPEDRQVIDGAVREAVQEKRPYDVEHRIVRPDGSVRVLAGHGRIVLDDAGRVIRMVGATQDITERRTAEETVRRSERRLRTIIDTDPACVKLVSAQCELLEINRAGLEMTGADDVSQLIGRPVTDLVHPEDRAAFLDLHERVCDGLPGALEFRIIGLDGQERWVKSHFVPFETFTETGEKRAAVLGVTNDITGSRRLEEQLRQSQKMEAVGMLAGGIAHDFNNLLTAIGGYTEFVLDTLDERDTRREDLQEVAKAAQRAAALTRQLLAVSRRQILQPSVLDVNGMVADVQKLLHRTIPESIDLQLALGPVDPVRADRGQLEQVLLNLAINAGDAMPQGGRLRLATATVDIDEAWAHRHSPMPAGRYVRLTVSDTGVGIPPETQARIFEPFFTTKARGKGTGLGLATVYGIVKQSEGFIWVESEVGRGTTFQVYLPAVREQVAAAVLIPRLEAISGGTQTILLAEDDGAVRRLARDVLAKQGYTVLDARDGDEALETARQYQGSIHLLIADVVMPGLSGRDLAERLAETRPAVRVLYTSGYTENLMKRAGFERGLALLAKPFLPADLLRAVNRILA